MALLEEHPSTRGAKWVLFLLYKVFHDFQNELESFSARAECNLSHARCFGARCAAMIALLYEARTRRRSSFVGPCRGRPSCFHKLWISIDFLRNSVKPSVHHSFSTPGLNRGKHESASLKSLVSKSYSPWIAWRHVEFPHWQICWHCARLTGGGFADTSDLRPSVKIANWLPFNFSHFKYCLQAKFAESKQGLKMCLRRLDKKLWAIKFQNSKN